MSPPRASFDGHPAAAQIEVAPERRASDEFSDKFIREPYPHFQMPAFSEWREEWQLDAALQDEFQAFAKEFHFRLWVPLLELFGWPATQRI